MRIRLNIKPQVYDNSPIWEIVKFLEYNLNSPQIIHEQMTMTGFFRARKWQIDMRETHWELVLHRKHANKPWLVELMLRWS